MHASFLVYSFILLSAIKNTGNKNSNRKKV